MAACTWNFTCPQTGVVSTITFAPGATFGSGTWTLELGGSVYQYTQSVADGDFCRSITLLRTSGTDGPTAITITGLQTPAQADAPALNCCHTIGTVQQPVNPQTWTLAISGQTGVATCMNLGGPFNSSGAGLPILAEWIIGHGGPFTSPDTCEGGTTFHVENIGGCLVPTLGDTQLPVGDLVSSTGPTDDPFVVVYQVDLTNIVGTGAGSATFTVSVPNPPP